MSQPLENTPRSISKNETGLDRYWLREVAKTEALVASGRDPTLAAHELVAVADHCERDAEGLEALAAMPVNAKGRPAAEKHAATLRTEAARYRAVAARIERAR